MLVGRPKPDEREGQVTTPHRASAARHVRLHVLAAQSKARPVARTTRAHGGAVAAMGPLAQGPPAVIGVPMQKMPKSLFER